MRHTRPAPTMRPAPEPSLRDPLANLRHEGFELHGLRSGPVVGRREVLGTRAWRVAERERRQRTSAIVENLLLPSERIASNGIDAGGTAESRKHHAAVALHEYDVPLADVEGGCAGDAQGRVTHGSAEHPHVQS